MLKQQFQGGTFFEVLAANPSKEIAWKVSNKKFVRQSYEKDVKGYCLTCEHNSKVAFPKDEKQSAAKITKHTALHETVPLSILRRGVWSNLCIDMHALVFTLKYRPNTFVESEEDPYLSSFDEIPRCLQFGPTVDFATQIISPERLKCILIREKTSRNSLHEALENVHPRKASRAKEGVRLPKLKNEPTMLAKSVESTSSIRENAEPAKKSFLPRIPKRRGVGDNVGKSRESTSYPHPHPTAIVQKDNRNPDKDEAVPNVIEECIAEDSDFVEPLTLNEEVVIPEEYPLDEDDCPPSTLIDDAQEEFNVEKIISTLDRERDIHDFDIIDPSLLEAHQVDEDERVAMAAEANYDEEDSIELEYDVKSKTYVDPKVE
ncbi:hypothetical protein HDU97_000765 [Phlyctochytrium planicorne]|nr:hypothetical protein HDU97_000765 [Phlyctochytrium planicorne]